MKRIKGLLSAPAGLAAYRSDPATPKNWRAFSERAGTTKRDVAYALTAVQHGLCAYCEINLLTDDRQIEHVVPRSGAHGDPGRMFDDTNLVACCLGGTSSVPARTLLPRRDNWSCGYLKDDRHASDFLDPRGIPTQPPLFEIQDDGGIAADPTGCTQAGLAVAAVTGHIAGLGLDVRRLRQARATAWAALVPILEQRTDENDADYAARLDQDAASLLLPDGDGKLAPFFSTIRSFFGGRAEAALARTPQDWI